jgi:hypothetical protein
MSWDSRDPDHSRSTKVPLHQTSVAPACRLDPQQATFRSLHYFSNFYSCSCSCSCSTDTLFRRRWVLVCSRSSRFRDETGVSPWLPWRHNDLRSTTGSHTLQLGSRARARARARQTPSSAGVGFWCVRGRVASVMKRVCRLGFPSAIMTFLRRPAHTPDLLPAWARQ